MVLLIAALLMLFAEAHAQTTFVLNSDDDPPYATDDFKGICDRVMLEAFRRLGMTLKIARLPSERALVNVNESIDDGNYSRVEGLDKQYPNLIRVPEEIAKFEFVAFTGSLKFRTEKWDSLKPYNVGIVTGWKILENNVLGTKSLVKVNDAAILFNLLKQDRADLVVYDRRQGVLVLKKLNMHGIHVLEPPLAIKSMYPYLNVKHKELVPRLTATLREMKKDGTYANIVDEVLREVFLIKNK